MSSTLTKYNKTTVVFDVERKSESPAITITTLKTNEVNHPYYFQHLIFILMFLLLLLTVCETQIGTQLLKLELLINLHDLFLVNLVSIIVYIRLKMTYPPVQVCLSLSVIHSMPAVLIQMTFARR